MLVRRHFPVAGQMVVFLKKTERRRCAWTARGGREETSTEKLYSLWLGLFAPAKEDVEHVYPGGVEEGEMGLNRANGASRAVVVSDA